MTISSDLLCFTNLIFKMNYYFSKLIQNIDFDKAIERATEELKKEGFGVLTEINIKDTLKQKIDVDFRKYKILGACNPHLAYKALQSESKIGVILPCNVIVEELENGEIEVSAMDPIPAMGELQNPVLEEVAKTARGKLEKVINNL